MVNIKHSIESRGGEKKIIPSFFSKSEPVSHFFARASHCSSLQNKNISLCTYTLFLSPMPLTKR
jgi:hypothetical protein